LYCLFQVVIRASQIMSDGATVPHICPLLADVGVDGAPYLPAFGRCGS
jgi:hypothetical protein